MTKALAFLAIIALEHHEWNYLNPDPDCYWCGGFKNEAPTAYISARNPENHVGHKPDCVRQLAIEGLRQVFIILVFLLVPMLAFASPITSTIQSGACGGVLPDMRWQTADPTGMVFMAFHDKSKGCSPTIFGNTWGVFEAKIIDGKYTVLVNPLWLPKCGHVQFDAHAYSATGLDPLGLMTYVYDTGVDCEEELRPSSGSNVGGVGGVPLVSLLPPTGHEVTPFTPDDPGDPGCPGCIPDTRGVTPIPEPATLWLVGGMLIILRKRIYK